MTLDSTCVNIDHILLPPYLNLVLEYQWYSSTVSKIGTTNRDHGDAESTEQ